MFSKTNLCAVLLCFVAILSTAAPLGLRADIFAERELVPVVPGTQIQPPLVDLLDQYENLQQQFDAASPDDPNFDALSTQLNTTKANLDQAIKGIAVLTTLDASVPTDASASASPTPTGTSTDTTASASTTSPPSNTVNTNVPEVTVVTQVGTSIVVIASEGVTSTITLATITTVKSGPPSPTSSGVLSTSSPGATGSGNPSTTRGGANPKSNSVTKTTSSTSPTATGKTANSSVEQPSGSGAFAVAPQSIFTMVLGGSLLSIMMAL